MEKTDLLKLLLPNQTLGSKTLKPEQLICVEFANSMRQMTLENNIPYVWFHIPNEFLPSARVNYSFENKLKHMGKIAGVPDYCLLSHKDCFFIEFKAQKRPQTPAQKLFEKWCADKNVSYFLCRTAQEGINLVIDRSKSIA